MGDVRLEEGGGCKGGRCEGGGGGGRCEGGGDGKCEGGGTMVWEKGMRVGKHNKPFPKL